MLYLFGDIHGGHDIKKMNRMNFPEGKHLTSNDYICILGDFGLCWCTSSKQNGYKEEQYWLKWLYDSFPKTKILVTLGNHENYDLISQLPNIDMFGDTVKYYRDNIYILERGHVYNIDGYKILSMCGAMSTDKNTRQEHVSWWRQENWTKAEEDYCIDTLIKHNWEVDYVFTHTAPSSVVYKLLPHNSELVYRAYDPLSKFFEFLVQEYGLSFKKWYFGHFHVDLEIQNKYFCLFNNIKQIK